MNLVVFGPDMESRPMPAWALRPIDSPVLTGVEQLVESAGHAIFGVPWVSPRGHGRQYASISDYLDDPVLLWRALEVALRAPRSPVQGAVIAADGYLETLMSSARGMVDRHLSSGSSGENVVWWVFNPPFNAYDQEGVATFLDALHPLGQ